MASEGFLERYRRFFQQRDEAKGFEFHNPPPKSVAPPIVLFSDKLRWWSWNRWQRRKKIRAERDRVLRELSTQVGQIAVELAGRVVEKELDKTTQQQLVDEFIEQVSGSENGKP